VIGCALVVAAGWPDDNTDVMLSVCFIVAPMPEARSLDVEVCKPSASTKCIAVRYLFSTVCKCGSCLAASEQWQCYRPTCLPKTHPVKFTVLQNNLILYCHPRMRRDNAFGRVCLFVRDCVCVCPSCSSSDFWQPWPRNLIFGVQICLRNI